MTEPVAKADDLAFLAQLESMVRTNGLVLKTWAGDTLYYRPDTVLDETVPYTAADADRTVSCLLRLARAGVQAMPETPDVSFRTD